jgi:hypothetical protein
MPSLTGSRADRTYECSTSLSQQDAASRQRSVGGASCQRAHTVRGLRQTMSQDPTPLAPSGWGCAHSATAIASRHRVPDGTDGGRQPNSDGDRPASSTGWPALQRAFRAPA